MPQDVQSRRSIEGRDEGERLLTSRNLAILYEGVFTVIVRMQAQRQLASAAETFRTRIKTVLTEVERDAIAAGYSANDIRDTHFAVVAFLDSVVLHSNDPVRPEWERQTLQEELFGQTDAGVVFFEKLENFRSRSDSAQLADMLEVYLLCLLLGFEGRYSGRLRGELESIAEKVRRRIDDIRGVNDRISPSDTLTSAPTTQAPQVVRRTERLALWTLAAAIFTVLLFLLFKIDLIWIGTQLRNKFS
jgi:type VI secretion system protein ImpK